MARPKAPAPATAKKALTVFLLEEPVKVAIELDAVAVPAPEAETDAGTDEADVTGGGELAGGELGTAELLAAEVRVAALAEEALDAEAEDVGAVEEAGEDAAVDEGTSEADPAPELTAVAGVTTPPSTLEGTTCWAFLAADL
jgi:hypothetical protein